MRLNTWEEAENSGNPGVLHADFVQGRLNGIWCPRDVLISDRKTEYRKPFGRWVFVRREEEVKDLMRSGWAHLRPGS